ncbi:MAG TPA: MCE family protein [Actinophytocola sp.]|uniref:MCE family protein n=1 Tax=Actinophytocola sp. TaxID=1872138 RepID=UPI002DDDA978|nr:MCE family protein [Actinophytocola sp.]HEV2778030.1 MCE family protein [Actinophytocola sp.]
MAALLCAGVLALGGCGFTGIYDLPLPGGADVGDHPYRVKVQFTDVLDLVPQSGVKVNEVAVGRVEEINLAPDGWTAEVTLLVNGDVKLPANASAKLRQSSLLGEKFIDLSTPPQPQGTLTDGALIPVNRTNRNTEVEEVLGALSMLLNGGGVDQLQKISQELNAALEGNEANIRSTLDNVTTFVSTVDASRTDITRAIDGLNRLAGTLNTQRDQIATAIDDLGPGLQVLADQRSQLVTMLQALDALSAVAVDTVNRSQADIVADLKALMPALQKLGEAGNDLPKALELLLTIPFPDEAVNDVRGDYFNLFAKIDLNLQSVIDNLSRSRNNPLGDLPILGELTGGQQGAATGSPLPSTGAGQAGPQQQPSGSTGACGILEALLGGCK